MTVSDKKDIKALLAILDSASTREAKSNKLSKLSIEADDPRVKKAATMMKLAIQNDRGVTKHLPTYIKPMVRRENLTRAQRDVVEAFEAVVKFCQQELAAVEPQWQRIARAAGWTPPVS
jgi:hypothetical protein